MRSRYERPKESSLSLTECSRRRSSPPKRAECYSQHLCHRRCITAMQCGWVAESTTPMLLSDSSVSVLESSLDYLGDCNTRILHQGFLKVPSRRLKVTDLSFTVTAVKLWNQLKAATVQATTFEDFRWRALQDLKA